MITKLPQPTPVLAPPDCRWTRAWYIWIASFFVIEGSALARRRPQDTLSDHVWRWFGIPQHNAPPMGLRTRRLVLIASLSWLVSHFLSGDNV